LDAALAKGGETADALLLAAQVNAAKSDWKSAQTFADKALNVSPDPQAYAIRVNAFLVDHQMAKAIEMLSGLDPLFLADNPELYLLLAELQIDAGAQKDAEHTIAAYRDAYPNDRDVFEYLAARGLLKKGAVADAIAKLETVVSQMPDFSRARFYLGLAYLDRGDKDRAKNTFEIYLKNNPEDERARAIWDAAFADRSPEQVEGAAAKLLENDTAYSGSLFMAAYSLMKTKPGVEGSADHLELAKKLLEKAIERSPSEPQGYRDLLFLYLGRKDLENARQVLARAESAGLSSSTLNLLRAGMALAEDQPAQAKESFQRELEAGAMASAKALEWAGLFSDMGQADMSLEMLAAAQARANTDEDRRELELAPIGLCVKSGDLDKALAFIDQVGAKYATLPDVIRRLDDQRIALARIWLAPGERRNVAKASRLVADIAKAEPDRVDAKTLQVRLLLQQAPPDVDAAETLCASLRKPDKPDPELLVLASDIASQKAQFAKALDFATQANNAAPDEFNIQMTLARAQIQMDLYADAVATLEKMRSRDPGNRSVLESLARAYAGAKRFEEADALIKQLAAGGDAGAVDSLRASVLASRGQWAPAEQLLRKRYEADPNDYATIRALGRTLFSSGQKDRAVAFLKECNDRQPDNPELWVELGNAYLAMGDAPNRSEASLAFSRALVQQPGYAPALQGMLDVQLRADNLGGALGLCDRFLAATPDNADMLQQKALLLARLPDRRKEALETIQKAIDIAKRPEFIFLRGSLYLSQNEFAKALEDFLQVSQARKTRSAELECLMAETYLGLNDPSLARFYCNSAKDKAAKGERVDSIRMERLASRIEKAMHQ
jgi:predicted Zn-dependent protease